MKHSKKSLLITAVIVVVVGAGAFWGGMFYQQKQEPRSAQFGTRSGERGQMVRFNDGQNMQAIVGEIISLDESSLTVKLSNGSSKIIVFSDKTTIQKQETVSKNEVKTGEKIAVFGTNNSDGSVMAQSIQLNPQFGGRGDMMQSTSK